MARSVLFGCLACVVLLLATVSRGDTPQPTQGSDDIGSGSGTGQTDPGLNPWHYADLSAAEKAYVDRAGNTTGWDAINAAFANAATERATAAAAQAAADQLGVDSLASEGVVP